MAGKNSDNAVLIVILVVVLLFLVGFGSYGMMGFGGFGGMMGGYGNNWMCAHMGGIWCYWPSFGWVIQVLAVVALVLFIIWIVKQLRSMEPFTQTRSLKHTHSKGGRNRK